MFISHICLLNSQLPASNSPFAYVLLCFEEKKLPVGNGNSGRSPSFPFKSEAGGTAPPITPRGVRACRTVRRRSHEQAVAAENPVRRSRNDVPLTSGRAPSTRPGGKTWLTQATTHGSQDAETTVDRLLSAGRAAFGYHRCNIPNFGMF